LHMAL